MSCASYRSSLVKLQSHLIRHAWKILVIFEGAMPRARTAPSSGSPSISATQTRAVALGKPSDHDLNTWYFQRWVPHLPAAHELVLFNRSWYNRAGVERVMGSAPRRSTTSSSKQLPILSRCW